MARPQLENGFARIANELSEQFARRDFSKREYAVLWAVLRLTYGYNRKGCILTPRILADGTGIEIDNARKTISGLVSAHVLEIIDGSIGIQKDHDRWQILPRGPVKTTGLDEAKAGQTNRLLEMGARSKQPGKSGQNNRANPVKTTGPTDARINDANDSQVPKDMKDMKDTPLPPRGDEGAPPFLEHAPDGSDEDEFPSFDFPNPREGLGEWTSLDEKNGGDDDLDPTAENPHAEVDAWFDRVWETKVLRKVERKLAKDRARRLAKTASMRARIEAGLDGYNASDDWSAPGRMTYYKHFCNFLSKETWREFAAVVVAAEPPSPYAGKPWWPLWQEQGLPASQTGLMNFSVAVAPRADRRRAAELFAVEGLEAAVNYVVSHREAG